MLSFCVKYSAYDLTGECVKTAILYASSQADGSPALY